MDSQIEHLAFVPGEAMNFLNFCELHQKQLERVVQINSRRSTCVYCLAHAWSDEDIKPSLLPNPKDLCRDVETGAMTRDIDVSAFCEVLECLYRADKRDHDIDRAREILTGRLVLYSKIAESKELTERGRHIAIHHKAKALRNVGKFSDAQALCETLVAEFDNPATSLLLARLLLHGDIQAVNRARGLLLGILDDAKASPEQAEISVVLASIETLGRGLLKKALPDALRDALREYGELVAEFIMSSAARGFDQALVAFAAIGNTLRYHDQVLFMKVLESLGQSLGYVTPEDVAEEKERAAWANIFLSASEARSVANTDDYARRALKFFDSLTKPDNFLLQQKGHALYRLSCYEDARDVLQPLVTSHPNPWNRYWLAKAYFELGNLDEAIALIDGALADPKVGTLRAALLEHRYEVRKKRGDACAVEDLEKARDACVDEKYLGALRKKLAEISK